MKMQTECILMGLKKNIEAQYKQIEAQQTKKCINKNTLDLINDSVIKNDKKINHLMEQMTCRSKSSSSPTKTNF